MKLILAIFLTTLNFAANADDRRMPPPEVRAAVQSCAADLNLDIGPGKGRLASADVARLRTCVNGKGYELPPPPRPDDSM